MIEPQLTRTMFEIERELREIAISRPRLDRPEVGRHGRLRRRLASALLPPARVSSSPAVTIRPAVHADDAQLAGLAEVSERRLPSGLVLVAEVESRVAAALPVAGGPLLMDVFRPTGDLVQLLELRSEQLRAGRRSEAA